MAATQYQVMYRYVNEVTNNVITNSSTSKYDELCEFYNHNHKLIRGTNEEKIEAENEKDAIITLANSADNIKNDMLFAYAGTKKIKSTKFVPRTEGYLVRDWTIIDRSLIGDRGDYSKDFVTIGAPTPEDGGIVVCKDTAILKYFTPGIVTSIKPSSNTDLSSANGDYYSEQKIINLLIDSTYFTIKTVDNYAQYGNAPNTGYYPSHYDFCIQSTAYYALSNNVFIKTPEKWNNYHGDPVIGSKNSDNVYSSFTLTTNSLERYDIPEHYEETSEYPYLIKDTYVRITLSPWFVNSTCSSLEAAIVKARQLIGMIGKDNVKVIKLVAIDQFIKIS